MLKDPNKYNMIKLNQFDLQVNVIYHSKEFLNFFDGGSSVLSFEFDKEFSSESIISAIRIIIKIRLFLLFFIIVQLNQLIGLFKTVLY